MSSREGDAIDNRRRRSSTSRGGHTSAAWRRALPLCLPLVAGGLRYLTPTAAAAPHLGAERWRERLPPAGPPPPFTAPRVVERRLPNGLGLRMVERHSLPLVELRLVVKVDAAAVGAAHAGLPRLVAEVLQRGAGRHSSLALAAALAAHGATLRVEAEHDFSFAAVETLAERLEPSLALLADVVERPRLRAPSIERARAHLGSELDARRADARAIAEDELRRLVYGAEHAYGAPALGTHASLARLERGDVVDFYRAVWRPDNATLVIVGDVDPVRVEALVARHFGAWHAVAASRRFAPAAGAADAPVVAGATATLVAGTTALVAGTTAPPVPPPRPPEVKLVDRPGVPQAVVAVGHLGLPRASADWPALDVANFVFGAGYASRINLELREEKGYTYSVRSQLTAARGPGLFLVRSTTLLDKTVPALRAILAAIGHMGAAPPSAEELERATEAAALGALRCDASNAEMADAITTAIVFDLPADYLERYVAAVRALAADDVLAAARKYLHAGAAHVVAVGPAEALLRDHVGDIIPAAAPTH